MRYVLGTKFRRTEKNWMCAAKKKVYSMRVSFWQKISKSISYKNVHRIESEPIETHSTDSYYKSLWIAAHGF